MHEKREIPSSVENEGIWVRSGWDSNPRGVAAKLISSQPRYDRFDTAPCCFSRALAAAIWNSLFCSKSYPQPVPFPKKPENSYGPSQYSINEKKKQTVSCVWTGKSNGISFECCRGAAEKRLRPACGKNASAEEDAPPERTGRLLRHENSGISAESGRPARTFSG